MGDRIEEYAFETREEYYRAIVMQDHFSHCAPCWHDRKDAYGRPYGIGEY